MHVINDANSDDAEAGVMVGWFVTKLAGAMGVMRLGGGGLVGGVCLLEKKMPPRPHPCELFTGRKKWEFDHNFTFRLRSVLRMLCKKISPRKKVEVK